jgi:hypothetical protein
MLHKWLEIYHNNDNDLEVTIQQLQSDESITEDNTTDLIKVICCLELYHNRFADDKEGIAEIGFDLELMKYNNNNYMFAGKMDLLDSDSGIIKEFKTTEKDIADGSPYWQEAFLSPQCVGYYKAALEMSSDIKQLQYIVFKRVMLRLKKNETIEQYTARVMENSEMKVKTIPITKSMVEKWQQEMIDTVKVLDFFYSNGIWPKYKSQCNGKFGKCPFYAHCNLDADLECGLYIKKERQHEELELELETDTED